MLGLIDPRRAEALDPRAPATRCPAMRGSPGSSRRGS